MGGLIRKAPHRGRMVAANCMRCNNTEFLDWVYLSPLDNGRKVIMVICAGCGGVQGTFRAGG